MSGMTSPADMALARAVGDLLDTVSEHVHGQGNRDDLAADAERVRLALNDAERAGASGVDLPADLPATLASVDDVHAECQRLGLDEATTGSAVGKWCDGTVHVLATQHVFDVDGVEQVDLGLMVWREGARSRVKLGGGISRAVFEAAIQAARSAS